MLTKLFPFLILRFEGVLKVGKKFKFKIIQFNILTFFMLVPFFKTLLLLDCDLP